MAASRLLIPQRTVLMHCQTEQMPFRFPFTRRGFSGEWRNILIYGELAIELKLIIVKTNYSQISTCWSEKSTYKAPMLARDWNQNTLTEVTNELIKSSLNKSELSLCFNEMLFNKPVKNIYLFSRFGFSRS